jgi:hypothetical protein
VPEPFLPPSLAALAEAPRPPLQSVALRLDPIALARVEALRDHLNRPSRGATLRALIAAGLSTVEAQLQLPTRAETLDRLAAHRQAEIDAEQEGQADA